jgi:molybdopterin-binding protein
MKFALIGRIAGVVALTVGLAACVDMTEELNITSDTTAKATMTMTMGSDIYAMMKAADTSETKDEDKFCAKEGEQLTENADGSATCIATSEGTFDQLKFDEGDGKPTFTVVSPGVVRVAFPTKDMMGEIGKDSDEQTAAMMKQMFDGHFLTIRIGGKEVTDTNLTLGADRTSAEIKIPFLDLINGSAQLPEELYAVVRTN